MLVKAKPIRGQGMWCLGCRFDQSKLIIRVQLVACQLVSLRVEIQPKFLFCTLNVKSETPFVARFQTRCEQCGTDAVRVVRVFTETHYALWGLPNHVDCFTGQFA